MSEGVYIVTSTVLARIKTMYKNFGSTSQRLAKFILDNGSACAGYDIKTFANKANVSTATLSRFANQLGYQSFSQFRWALSNDFQQTSPREQQVLPNDSPIVVANKMLKANIDTLNETFSLLTNEQLKKAADLITKANTVGFFGLGSSNIVAEDCYHKFLRTPKHTVFANDYHINIMLASKLTSNDLALLISHTGNDTDILYIASMLKEQHVPIISITSYTKSPLDNYAEVSLHSISSDSKYRNEALLSVTSQLAITDTLYMLTDQRFNEESTAIINTINNGLDGKHLG